MSTLAKNTLSFTRHVLLMFGKVYIHDVPLLRVANEDVHRGFEPAWVVQTGSHQADDIAFRVFPDGQARAAFGAEGAQVMAAAQSCGGIMLQCAYGNREGFQRHDHHGRIWPAAHPLAIATMTFHHPQRTGIAFVANFAANASAGERKVHGSEIILMSEKMHFKAFSGLSKIWKMKGFQRKSTRMIFFGLLVSSYWSHSCSSLS